jgi:hypothetical protein
MAEYGYVGGEPTQAQGQNSGVFQVNDVIELIGLGKWSSPVILDSIEFYVDASNPSSYSGSGTTWYDLSPNGYDLTLTNSPTYVSGDDAHFDFNGTNQYAIHSFVPSIITNYPYFTTEVWARTDGNTSSTYHSIFQLQANNTSGGGAPAIRTLNSSSTSVLDCHFFNSSDVIPTNAQIQSTTGMSTSAWRHICYTYDQANTRLYINGSLETTSGSVGSQTVDGFELIQVGTGDGRYLNGDVAIVRHYSQTLSDAEVLANFNAEKGKFGL